MTITIWVLTKEYNEYEQYGEYFIAAFKSLPTHKMLVSEGVPNNLRLLDHILAGGGRVDKEDSWYFLHKVQL